MHSYSSVRKYIAYVPMQPPSVNEAEKENKIAISFPWAQSLLEPVKEFCVDWDGYGALPPEGNALKYAALLLACLRASGHALIPTVDPLANGGVNLEYQEGPHVLYIEVDPSGEVQFLYKNDTVATSTRSDSFQIENGIPASLLLCFRLMSSGRGIVELI